MRLSELPPPSTWGGTSLVMRPRYFENAYRIPQIQCVRQLNQRLNGWSLGTSDVGVLLNHRFKTTPAPPIKVAKAKETSPSPWEGRKRSVCEFPGEGGWNADRASIHPPRRLVPTPSTLPGGG